jgi:WD40 repeat protein
VFQPDCDVPFRWRRLQRVDFRSDYARGLETLVTPLTSKVSVSKAQHLVQNESGIDSSGFKPPLEEPDLELKHRQHEVHRGEVRVKRERAERQVTLLRTLEGHSRHVTAVAVTADGKRAVSASGDQTLKVWNLESGHALRTLEGHSNLVNNVAVTPDGRWAVSASSDHTLKVWDLESGRELRTLEGHSSSVRCVAMTPGGEAGGFRVLGQNA